jgi:putative intracellular protease/amidase
VLYVLSAKDHFPPGYFEARAELEQAGFAVIVAAATELPLRALSKGKGVPVKPNILLSQARAADYDALIVCTAISYWEFTGDCDDARRVRQLIADMRAAGKPVAGLGTAVAVLGDAGILRGKLVTCQAWEIERLVKAGAKVDRSRSVVEAREGRLGPILTGRDPFSARELARSLVRVLSER